MLGQLCSGVLSCVVSLCVFKFGNFVCHLSVSDFFCVHIICFEVSVSFCLMKDVCAFQGAAQLEFHGLSLDITASRLADGGVLLPSLSTDVVVLPSPP